MKPKHRHSLRDGFNAYGRALPGVHDLVSHRRLQIACTLDTSPGVPGPHAFAVRKCIARLTMLSRPSHPASNTRDDREAPLSRARDGTDDGHDSGFQQWCEPAADWHDGQFSHDAYAQVSLGLSGKSVRGPNARVRNRLHVFLSAANLRWPQSLGTAWRGRRKRSCGKNDSCSVLQS